MKAACTDAGPIARILSVESGDDKRIGDGGVEGIVVDGVTYSISTRMYFYRIGGWCFFQAVIDPGGRYYKYYDAAKIPEGLRDGAELPSDAEHPLSGICTDPRVLYIINRGWELVHKYREAEKVPEADVAALIADIPTREQAEAHLDKNRIYRGEPRTVDEVGRMLDADPEIRKFCQI